MKAVFRDKFHISSTDRESLESQLDTDVDALFVKQREDRISSEKWSIGYLSFLIGALTLYWLQAFLYNGPDIKEKTEVPVHDKIDTDLPVLYPRFPKSWILGSGIFSSLVLAAGLFVPVYPFPFIDAPAIASLAFTVLVKPLMVIGAPLLFSFFLIFLEERRLGIRDQDMAEEINRISDENGYEIVVVSYGDTHLHQVPGLLEEKVGRQRSTSPTTAGKLKSNVSNYSLSRIHGGISNPGPSPPALTAISHAISSDSTRASTPSSLEITLRFPCITLFRYFSTVSNACLH